MKSGLSWRSLSLVPCALKAYYDYELENKKHLLLTSIQDTQRGLLTTTNQCSCIEEALVSLEGCNIGCHPINLSNLDGTWRLQYTSSSDVLILLQAVATLPFFQVGQIFQKFECCHQSNGSVIRNVVRWSIPNLLERVGAKSYHESVLDVISVPHHHDLTLELHQVVDIDAIFPSTTNEVKVMIYADGGQFEKHWAIEKLRDMGSKFRTMRRWPEMVVH
ncbi:hypothetical protein JHK87_039688 [Glycine soja]|nr:hypothetical protein JHK87_039688 [Glycine soja]